MAAVGDDSFPTELNDRLTALDDSLTNVDSVLQTLHELPLSEIHEKASPLDKARLDIVGAYAMNSLFWMYLNSKGENPKDHGVKEELDRIRKYMDRVKEVHEKLLADVHRPRVNKDASKRFIRSALWQAAKKQTNQGEEEEEGESSTPGPGPWEEQSYTASDPQTGPTKRFSTGDGEQEEPKKKKKRKKKKVKEEDN